MNLNHSRLTKIGDYLIQKKSEKQALENSIAKMNVDLSEAEKTQALIEKSLLALQKLTEIKKRETIQKIEDIISFGLQSIFEDSSYKFEIHDTIKRKQVSYDFRVYSDSFKSDEGVSIIDSRGGGLVAVTSFLLRLILLCMIDKKAERFIALDEPFAALSENYHQNLVTAVKQISKKLNVQLLIVSHQKSLDLMGDKVYRLQMHNGATSAHLVRDDSKNLDIE